MTKKLVWIVENIETGDIRSNWSTGTRVYTRKLMLKTLAQRTTIVGGIALLCTMLLNMNLFLQVWRVND